MKLNFCTLFNSNYLARGLVMYESLLAHCADFHLYVFAFDDAAYKFLSAQQYTHLTVVSLKEFEDEDLLAVKPGRSAAEYCWTCTSSTVLYCINNFALANCTYVDADMRFYSDPAVLVQEMGSKSVLITEHRYTSTYDQAAISGKYCVQFVSFKNDEAGLKVLKWWRERCIEWCYARVEDGKFGDQKYLDVWPTLFDGVHELAHLGGGIAPWNLQQYSFSVNNGKIEGTEIKTGKKFEAVFFHFHGLKFYDDNIVRFTDALYVLSEEVKTIFYAAYVKALVKCKEAVSKAGANFDANGAAGKAPARPMGPVTLAKYYLSGIKTSPKNIFGKGLRARIDGHYYYNAGKF